MSYNDKMVYTENPYVDIIVHNVKQLGIGTVLKMEDNALAKETLESKRNADFLLMCMEGTASFNMFDWFSESVLRKSGITDEITLSLCILNPENVPKAFRDEVVRNARKEFIESYEELNDYYRMLNGKPPMGYTDVYTKWEPTDGIHLDTSIPVHEMSYDALIILNANGVLDSMYEEDKENRGYLKHVLHPIDPFTARRAGPFAILHVPTIESNEIYNEYRDRLTINRAFTMQTVYSSAYKYESDYYDNFIAVFIILNTMCDVIARTNEFITRREVFDIRTVRYIFESYGVTYFPEIPMKYQIRMVKNLHTLIKYKGTPKCMIDICSLFGFENITVFKYYLFRSRKYDRAKDEYSFTGDPEEDFDLKFIKIPIDEPMDDYIRNSTYHYDYDEITEQDPTWDGGLEHDEVKRQHLAENFNYTRTKYLSVDAIYDLAKISIQQCYFFNMLYDNIKLETEINLAVPYLSPEHKFNIADIFIFLTCITYMYHNMKDIILDTQSKVLTVYGFNFKADLAAIATDLANMDYYDDEIKALFEKFRIPTDSIPNMTQLMNLFINNLEVRDALVIAMREADNLKIYNTYKYLYDSLMVMELTMDFFKDPETGDFYRDADGDATYTEYLKHKDPTLYYKLIEIENLDDVESKSQTIANIIDNITYILEQYIDTQEFSGLFHNLPVVSVEAVKEYIKSVIDFYKSYKVHFLGVNTLYVFDDKFEGWVKIIDWAIFNRYFEKDEIVPIIERVYKMAVTMTKRDDIGITDKAIIDRFIWAYKNYVEKARPKDRAEVISKLNLRSVLYPVETTYTVVRNTYEELVEFVDGITGIHNTFLFKDRCAFKDMIVMSRYGDDVTSTFEMDLLSIDINNVVVSNDENGTILFDGRINSDMTGTFTPIASMADLFGSAEVTCGLGMAKIVLKNCETDIVGTLNVRGSLT